MPSCATEGKLARSFVIRHLLNAANNFHHNSFRVHKGAFSIEPRLYETGSVADCTSCRMNHSWLTRNDAWICLVNRKIRGLFRSSYIAAAGIGDVRCREQRSSVRGCVSWIRILLCIRKCNRPNREGTLYHIFATDIANAMWQEARHFGDGILCVWRRLGGSNFQRIKANLVSKGFQYDRTSGISHNFTRFDGRIGWPGRDPNLLQLRCSVTKSINIPFSRRIGRFSSQVGQFLR